MKHFRSNKGFQATAHNLSLCNRFPSLLSFILMPVGRRLNPDVRLCNHIIQRDPRNLAFSAVPSNYQIGEILDSRSDDHAERWLGLPARPHKRNLLSFRVGRFQGVHQVHPGRCVEPNKVVQATTHNLSDRLFLPLATLLFRRHSIFLRLVSRA